MINYYIITNFQICDVDPLTVDVVVVDVLTAGRDALLPVVLTVVPRLHTLAPVVLQTEGGLAGVRRFMLVDHFVLFTLWPSTTLLPEKSNISKCENVSIE